jgi:hypothetical protein
LKKEEGRHIGWIKKNAGILEFDVVRKRAGLLE